MPTKVTSLDDLDAPPWFISAAEELKASRPRWVKALPEITLRTGEALSTAGNAWIFGAMVFMEAEAVRHDLLELLKRHADPASLDAWMSALLQMWLTGASPTREAWVLTSAGYLGGNATAHVLQSAVRKWIRDKDRALAVRGVDTLGRIGTKAAMEEVAILAAEIRSSSAADEAKQMISKKARAEGVSAEELEDRHVSTCGLDARGERIFSYGPRTFHAVLRRDLALVLYDQEKRKRLSLPPPAASDDLKVATASRAAWSEMKLSFKRVLKAQLKRFEQAMITGRSWSLAELRGNALQHPIIARIVQLLVWQTLAPSIRNVRITEDLTFADVNDEGISLQETDRLRVAHSLRLSPEEIKAWIALFTDYGIVQPFPQLNRPSYDCEPSMGSFTELKAPEHHPLKSGVLYGILDNDGWRMGSAHGSLLTWSWKSYVADDVTAVINYSGLIPGAIAKSPDQLITHCTFHSGAMAPGQRELPSRPIPLQSVPAVAYSETMRRLLRLSSLES